MRVDGGHVHVRPRGHAEVGTHSLGPTHVGELLHGGGGWWAWTRTGRNSNTNEWWEVAG